MRIIVVVKTRAREELVQKIDGTHYSVSVKALPSEGAANEAVVRVLARHFGIAQSRVTLVKGHSSKQKIFDIS